MSDKRWCRLTGKCCPVSSLEGPCVSVLPVLVSYVQLFSPPHRKEFAAITAARVIEASLVSLSWGFYVQLLMLVIVLPYALLDKSLSLRTFVVIFFLARNLCFAFLNLSRGAMFISESHVAVTRIQVYVVDSSLLTVQCVCIGKFLCRDCCIFPPVLY